MSLNRIEQGLFDYWETHLDEKRFWQERVGRLAAQAVDPSEREKSLRLSLADYWTERRQQVPTLAALAEREGGGKAPSLRNLAELLLRLWGPPVRRPPSSETRRL